MVLTKNLSRWLAIAVLIGSALFLSACATPAQVLFTQTPLPGTPTHPISLFPAAPTGLISPSPIPSNTLAPALTLEPSSTPVKIFQTPQPTPTVSKPLIFAAIGDYGTGDKNEEAVVNLVMGWQPDFIITLGDNNYPSGAANTMDAAVGQFFHSYIYPYRGKAGEGGDANRFFPTLGNHDVITENGKPYLDYFTLPDNGRYYDFTWGLVHLFALDDIETEPDGVGASSKQAQWLKTVLAESTSPWNIVYMHYPPYSSGMHGSTDWARWPYAEWGADAVLAGHDHTYERLDEAGLVYFVNGLGGGGIYNFGEFLPGSLVRYNRDYGAMRIEATETSLVFEFITVNGESIDRYELKK